MPTPSSGTISFNDIAAIAKAATGVSLNLNDSDVRKLCNKTTVGSAISMNDAYGKPVAITTSYTVPGSYTFIVPPYQYMDAYVAGGGGGGGGGGTQVPGLLINGGSGGGAGQVSTFNGPSLLQGGSGSGGAGGCGGSGGGAGTAGSGGTDQGALGGAGGSGGAPNGPSCTGGTGVTGNRRWTRYTFATGSYLLWGGSYTLTVGAGGAGGGGSVYGGGVGGTGGAGYVTFVGQ